MIPQQRLWFLLAATLLLLALAYAAGQLVLLGSLAPASAWGLDAQDGSDASRLAMAEVLQDEWRRFKWEVGQRPSAVEARDQP